jgi:hypothetical protein
VLSKSEAVVRTKGPRLNLANSMVFIRGVEIPRCLRKADSGVFQHPSKAITLLDGFLLAEARCYSRLQGPWDRSYA